MAEFNYDVLIYQIDVFLSELGTTGLVDARKARDQLMDLRLMCMSMKEVNRDLVPDIEHISPDLMDQIKVIQP